MKAPVVRLLVVGCVFAGVAAAAATTSHTAADESFSRDWKRVTSPNFTVVGNAGEGQLRAALIELERFRQALLILRPNLPLRAHVPTVLVLFKDDASFTRFKPRNARGKPQSTVAGYFARHPDVIYMAAAAWADRSATFGVIFHEYTHFVIHQITPQLPTWVDEGLAEFYSTFETDGEGRGILGRVPPYRVQTLRDEPLLSFDRFLTNEGTAKAFRNDYDRHRFYAQAWALVHYSMLGPRQGQLVTYLRALDQGRSPADAFRAAYNVSYDELHAELRAYLRRMQLPGMVVRQGKEERLAELTVERMTEVEAQHLQGDLLMRLGADEDAERALQRVLKADASHIPARVALAGVLRRRDRREEAIAILEKVTTDAPRDFGARYGLASDLFYTGRYEAAVEMWNTAVRLNENSSEAWLELSIASLAVGRDDAAKAAFGRALALNRDPSLHHTRAHRLFHLGHDSGIVADVQAYIRSAGWGNEASPYMAFLGAIAYWRLSNSPAADDLLAQASEAVPPESWTSTVATFLRGRIDDQVFLDKARDVGERTEAHAYIGLKASIAGKRDEAIKHLTWVKERGSRNYTEYGLAIAELRRLESVKPS